MLVLLLLGVGSLAASWLIPAPEPCFTDFFYQKISEDRKVPLVVRTAGKSYSEYGLELVKLSAGTACADTPPQLAMFFDLPMPLNRADQTSLAMLPGIGPRLAEQIFMFREETEKISGPAALGRINGIGKRLTERLAPMLCFD